jgi:hypothetical protein
LGVAGNTTLTGSLQVNGQNLSVSGNTAGGTGAYTTVGGVMNLQGPRGTQAYMRGLNAPGGNNDAASEMYNLNGGWGWKRAWIVGTGSPPYVTFDGPITAQSYNNNSDGKLKKNILDIENNEVEKFNSIRTVKFQWKDKPYLGRKVGEPLTAPEKETRFHYGLIAQELEKIFPSMVEDGEKTVIDYNSKGVAEPISLQIKSYSITDMLGLTVRVLQDANKKIYTLEAHATQNSNKITALESTIAKLTARLEKLEGKK